MQFNVTVNIDRQDVLAAVTHALDTGAYMVGGFQSKEDVDTAVRHWYREQCPQTESVDAEAQAAEIVTRFYPKLK